MVMLSKLITIRSNSETYGGGLPIYTVETSTCCSHLVDLLFSLFSPGLMMKQAYVQAYVQAWGGKAKTQVSVVNMNFFFFFFFSFKS